MEYTIIRSDADHVEPGDLAAIDRMLEADAKAFSRPREHLEKALERMEEAAVDRERLVLVARRQGAVVGFVDGQLHHPEPGALTISAIVVGASHRRHGLARRLVEAIASLARDEDGGDPPTLVAGVHAENAPARAFFESIGFVPKDESAKVLVLTRTPEPGTAETAPTAGGPRVVTRKSSKPREVRS